MLLLLKAIDIGHQQLLYLFSRVGVLSGCYLAACVRSDAIAFWAMSSLDTVTFLCVYIPSSPLDTLLSLPLGLLPIIPARRDLEVLHKLIHRRKLFPAGRPEL